MKNFEIKQSKRLLFLFASNLTTIIFADTGNVPEKTPPLNTAFSVAKTVVNTALPTSQMPPVSTSNLSNNISSVPAYTPPAAPLDRAFSVAKTLIDTATPPTTSYGPVPAQGSKVATNHVVNSKTSFVNKSKTGPFGSGNVVTKRIPVNHAHADASFKQKITEAWQQISAGDPKAFMNVNHNNASVIVKGEEQAVVDLENYITSLDKPIVQVRVDAIILFAQRNYNFDIGFDWSGIYNRAQSIINSANPFGFVGLGGSLQDIPKPTLPIDAYYVNSNGQPSTGSSPNSNLFVNPTNFAINLFNKAFSVTTADNAGSSYLQLPFVFGGPDLNLRRLNLVLSVAESESKVKIVSRPSVLTSSGQKAVVTIGQQLPMQQSAINSSTGAVYKGSQIVYKSVGIGLTVTPIVGADNKTINLTINIEDLEIISGSTQSNADGIMTNPPVLSDLAVTNIVTLKSGQTTVIGGLAKRTDKLTKNQIPWIYKIPVLGNLFKASLTADIELEQFIFITPTIVEENL
jgi:type II secretory pathway component GspD/PulD (secretin)